MSPGKGRKWKGQRRKVRARALVYELENALGRSVITESVFEKTMKAPQGVSCHSPAHRAASRIALDA
jgi:hypothetical protein